MKKSQNLHRQKSSLGLIRRHPVASVFALWVALLLLAGLSTAALMNVNNTQIPSTELSTTEVVPTQPPREEPQGQTLPLLSFGAIALSCTLGCLLLSQTFRSVGSQPVQRKTSRVRSAAPMQSAEFDTQESFNTASSDSPARSRSAGSSKMPLVASVTVVPKQQDHPLDWDEPSLADSLDMRQRRPLSHWL